MKFPCLYFAASLLAFSTSLSADTLELTNGKTLQGSFIGKDGDNVSFDVDGITMKINASDIKSIAMGEQGKPATQTASSNNKVNTAAEISAGTPLTIRLSEVLDSGQNTTGQKFTATLEGALINNGLTVAPAGSKVYGEIVEAVKARRIAGKAKIILTLTAININGQIITISSNSINAYTQATGKKTVGKVARGAAIGALADGSSGAETGAKVGLGVAILSKGNQVHIPAGTLLDFNLSKALKR